MTTLQEAATDALAALEAVEALIEHQYTGTREAMNALQNAADDAHDVIEPLRTALAQQDESAQVRYLKSELAHALAQQGEQPVAWHVQNGDEVNVTNDTEFVDAQGDMAIITPLPSIRPHQHHSQRSE